MRAYLGKCLVFVGALGLLPREIKGEPAAEKAAHPGDLIVTCGGRVGKDGIHGVTASSEVSSPGTPAGHVQIGDPYTQKNMHDFLLEARDQGLINFITDCGGGGLSSAVGESAMMAGGGEVELSPVPLKYQGLDPWEIWMSESQERMVVAVKPGTRSRLQGPGPQARGGGHRHRAAIPTAGSWRSSTRAAPAPIWISPCWRRSSRPGSSTANGCRRRAA